MERSILVDILTSLQRLFVGYIPAVVVGILCGIGLGVNGVIYQILKRILQIALSFVSIAFLPIALVLFRQTEPATFIVVFFSALWLIITETARGVRQFRRQGNNFRIATQHIFRALRLSVLFAWLTVIATEMLIGGRGLGVVVWRGYTTSFTNQTIEALIYIGVIGFVFDQLLDLTGYFLSQIVLESKTRDS